MKYSQACENALRALTYLATLDEGSRATVREISARQDLRRQSLAKVLQTLAHAGIVVSTRGKQGGFALARPSEEITLYDVVCAVDGSTDFTRCALGLPGCSAETPCRLHPQWKALRESIEFYLTRTTLAAMCASTERIQDS